MNKNCPRTLVHISLAFLVLLFLSVSNFAQYGSAANDGLNRQRVIASGSAIIGVVNNSAETNSKKDCFAMEKQAFYLINKQRAGQNLPELDWSDDVAKIARVHSNNMAQFKFFSHKGLDGLSVDNRADRLGISKWRAIGENIAFNRGFENPVESAVEGWMRSFGHRENILSERWKESGVGVAIASDGSYYFTQVFLTRK